MLDPCDVGHRVVVRQRAGTSASGRPMYRDVLGDLVTIGHTSLVVRTEDGTEHDIARSSVVAAKRIPPRPARHSEIAALERVADAAWPAPVHELLGDWLLRAADGFTNRANSALPLGQAGMPLADAVDACTVWYRKRGLTPRITVPLPLRRDVAAVLTARSWSAQPIVLVQTARLADIPGEPGPGAATDDSIALTAEPSPEFLQLVAARKGGLPDAARHVLGAVPAVRFAEVRDTRRDLIAVARGAVVDGWLHLGLVEVVASARRRGAARRATAALVGWGADAGASRAILQVEEENLPAVNLYTGLGFRTHHRYVTFAHR